MKSILFCLVFSVLSAQIAATCVWDTQVDPSFRSEVDNGITSDCGSQTYTPEIYWGGELTSFCNTFYNAWDSCIMAWLAVTVTNVSSRCVPRTPSSWVNMENELWGISRSYMSAKDAQYDRTWSVSSQPQNSQAGTGNAASLITQSDLTSYVISHFSHPMNSDFVTCVYNPPTNWCMGVRSGTCTIDYE